MKLLHTGDWHLGKRLFGIGRMDEAEAALGEIVALAERERPDAIIVAGDLLDRRVVDPAAFGACLRAMEGLACVAPVLAVAGNHDDPELWIHLAPHLRSSGIHVAGRVQAVDQAVMTLPTAAGQLHAAMLPWPEPGRMALDAGVSVQDARLHYAAQVAKVMQNYATEVTERRRREGGVAILVGHLMVDRARAGGGEREITMGIAYTISSAALPRNLDYIALGHVHRPQPIPGLDAPGRYAGSPIALDFSDEGLSPSACILDIDGDTTRHRLVAITAARPLVRIRAPLERLPALAAGHPGAWFACDVELDAPVVDLVRQVRDAVPDAIRIEARYPEADPTETEGEFNGGERSRLPEPAVRGVVSRGRPGAVGCAGGRIRHGCRRRWSGRGGRLMRPLELDLTAFRSYDRATVDLRPQELVVITGDTGAGKTSLLDAISFAIFGKTPEQATPTDLLTLGHEHGEVRLTFGARGEVWRMTRRYGPRAPEPRQVLERLADDGGAVVESISGPDPVKARLSIVVGMGFKAFTSAVLLAQGRFAEFLSSAPKARDDILRELFGVASLDGARGVAQSAEAVALAEAELREGDRARLPAHDSAARTEAARAGRTASARHADAVRLRPLAERLDGYLAEEEASRSRKRAAEDAAADLPDEREATELRERIETAQRVSTAAEAELALRRADHARATKACDTLRAGHGGDAASLSGLRERAQRAGTIGAGLPARERELAGRESALSAQTTRERDLSAALADAIADDERLSAQAALIQAWRTSAAREAEGARGVVAAEAALRVATQRVTDQENALVHATAAHERARLHDLAATIRGGLAPGDECPVCGSAYAGHADDPGESAAAEGELEKVRTRLRGATSEAATAAERVRAARDAADRAASSRAETLERLDRAGVTAAQRAADVDEENAEERQRAIAAERAKRDAAAAEARSEAARIDAERESIARDRAELEATRTSLGGWGERPDPVGALAAAIDETQAAERAAGAAAAAVTAAGDAAAQAGRELADLERGPIAAMRTAAARAAARGRLDPPDDDIPATELIDAAVRLRGVAQDAARTHAQRADAAAVRVDEVRAALGAEGAPLGVEESGQVEPAIRRARAERDSARARLAEIEATSATSRRLAVEAATARSRAALNRQVALDLRANAFPRYLLARYRERLAVEASAHLQELSGGDYRFAGTEPDPLAVVDTRRGERRRSAATLSGGERFLASLALALGLSDVAAEAGGRLDCLFLDEGFSTLDAESLEQALAGVERLSGDGRLVGIITHLPGVADRLGAAIHVTKDPATGISSVSAGMVSA